MKFKIGDKVMLKAVPYDNFCFSDYKWAKKIKAQKEPWLITSLVKGTELAYLNGKYLISLKYLKHTVKPKPVKYTIDCRRMSCGKDCPERINGDVKICNFTGTKSQVEAHIKRYWKQPKIKAVS